MKFERSLYALSSKLQMIWLKLNIQSLKLHYSFVKLGFFAVVLKVYFDITPFQVNP